MSAAELTSILQELIRIPSRNPPGEEKTIGEYVASKFEGIDCELSTQEVCKDRENIIVTIDRSDAGPRILLNGHIDTVPVQDSARWKLDPFSGAKIGGRMYGLGASDMKGGIAAMIWAGRRLAKSLRRGKAVISFVVDEELYDRGAVMLAKSKFVRGLDSCIVMEPTGLKIAVAQRGFVDMQVEVLGRSAHASMPSGGLNAVTKMSEVVATRLRSYSERLRRESHPLLGPGTVNVGYIRGGRAVKIASIIPDRCKIFLERRFLPREDAAEIFGDMKTLFENGVRGEGYSVSVKKLFSMAGMETDRDAMVVRRLTKSAGRVLGSRTHLVGFPGYSEAEIFSRVAGIDSVVFGPGDLRLAHAPNEYVEIEQVAAAAEVLLNLFDFPRNTAFGGD